MSFYSEVERRFHILTAVMYDDVNLQIFWDIWRKRVRLRRWIPVHRRRALCLWTWSATPAG